MKYRKLDAAGDFAFGHQQSDYWNNVPDAVSQAVLTRLQLFTGEWFLDTSDGTPWRTEVLGKYTLQTYDAVIKDRILNTPGVTQITGYSSLFNGQKRSLTISATISTIYGSTTIKGTL